MIRKEAFTPDADTFASKRRTLLESTDSRLQPHVKDALRRIGLPSWQAPLIRAASEIFEEVANTESDGWSQELDSLRNEFQRELHEALDKTKKVDKEKFDQQVERITKWVSTMAINAGTEAATSTDPDPVVGLEWVTMQDSKVRDAHQEAHGQQTITGKPFTVGGVELLYPGEPVGDPSNWINCRCVARPAMLGEATMAIEDVIPTITGGLDKSAEIVVLTAAAHDDDDEMKETIIPRGEETTEETEPEQIPDEEASVQIMFHGVAAPEGVMSGDGRGFALGALTNRPLPIPLKAMFIDDEGHKGSAIAGRIDRMWKEDNLFKYEGVFDISEAGYETIRLIADQMWSGVSVDVDQAQGEPSKDGKGVMFSEARVSAATVCAIPAFAEAFIALGPAPKAVETPVITGEEAAGGTEDFAPETVPTKTKDGPGWITNPEPTKEITSYWVTGLGRAKIGWGAPGDFNRCRVQLAKYVQNPEWLAGLCANLHYRALGTWPGRAAHAGETIEMQMDEKAELPSVTLTASAALALTAVSADYFRKMEFSGPTPMTIEDDGHVYGHLAEWGTCHIGFPDECKTVPHSQTNYAGFLTGEYLTDAGRIPVGQITLGTGHAAGKLGMRGALAHYDNTGSAVADITVWEDDHGVAFSGKLREDLPEKDIRALMASPLSGDWRGVIVNGAESLEMCAALAVNVPGFAVPRVAYALEGDHQLSLVAAGALEPRPIISAEFENMMAEYTARENRRIRMAQVKREGRAFRAEIVKAKIDKVREK